MRTLIRLLLESEGYSVLEAGNGRDAIAIAADMRVELDILVADIIMPSMNGKDLATRISSIRPFLKVIFVSAYSAEIIDQHHLGPKGADYIQKPLSKAKLLAKIESVCLKGDRWLSLISKPA